MRRVQRHSVRKPEILNSQIVKDELARIYDHYSLDKDRRLQRRLDFNHSLLNSPEVYEALHLLFHGKCAYCESVINSSDYTIDHLRPIGNAINFNIYDENNIDSPDHYGWLAYEWNNLNLACHICNASKRNFFPVNGARAPILYSWEDANLVEQETILDPSSDSPHIHFKLDLEGKVSAISRRGLVTIQILNLNRMELVLARGAKLMRCLDHIDMLSKALIFSEFEDSVKILNSRSNLASEFDNFSEFAGISALFFKDRLRSIAKKYKLHINFSGDLANAIINLHKLLPVDVEIKTQIYELEPKKSLTSPNFIVQEKEYFPKSVITESGIQGQYFESNSVNFLISRIEIKNFKGIRDLTFDFQSVNYQRLNLVPCSALLGENSTGKSSVLQAITMCLMSKSDLARLKLNPIDFISRESNGWRLSNEVTKVKIFFSNRISTELVIDPLRKEFELSDTTKSIVMAYGARRFFDEETFSNNKFNSLKTLFDPLATISNPITWLKEANEHEFNAAARAIREVFVLSDNDSITKENGMVSVTAGGRNTPIEKLSEGYKSLFAMTIDVCRNLLPIWGNLEEARGVVLIDEVETHLHPRWKMKIMRALRSAFPKVQFIVTTHDPLILRGMYDGEVNVLFRNDELIIEKIQDLPSIKSLRTEQLLTSDYFGLYSTSDIDFEDSLDRYALLASKSNTQMADVEITELGKLEKMLEKNLVVGDSPAEQIAFEALNKYVNERNKVNSEERKDLQKKAVEQVLDFLIEQNKK